LFFDGAQTNSAGRIEIVLLFRVLKLVTGGGYLIPMISWSSPEVGEPVWRVKRVENAREARDTVTAIAIPVPA
jgi:hypothetical protein